MDFLAPGSREPRPVHLPGSPDPQAFLAAFVAAAADAVVGIARDGTVLSWNPAAERIFGYRASDIVGQPFARLVPPDLLPELDDIAARVLAGHPVTCDTVRLARDGRPVPVRLMSAPVRDGEGRIVGRAATLTDITDRLRAEAERRATEERLTLALEGAEDGYWDWDLETGESFLSPRWYRLLGYEPGALPAHADTWQRLLHPDDRPGVWARLQAHLAGEVPQYEAEQRMRHRDGHWVWVLARGKVVERLPGENGRPGPPRRMVGTMLDISARKAVELAMREREADQRFLVDLSVALQATTDPEALGAIALARIAEHFGAAVCGWTTHAPGGDSFTIQQEYRDGTVVRLGQVVPMTVWPPDVAAALAAGETLAIADVTDDPRVEAHHAAQFAPLRRRANLAAPMLREGRWVGTISLFGPEPRAWTPGEQVLFRAAAERLWSALETARALREADLERGRLQALLDALPVGVLVADGDGAIVHFSEALARIMRGTRLVGSAEEYAHYRAWWTASGEPLRPEEWGLARALRDGTTSVGELIDVERLDGTRATILNAAAPVRDAAGQVVGAVAAVLDVTDQRRLEERLRHAQKLEAVGQLAGGIAHDFNNLLTVIKGNLEFVQEALEDELPGGHPVLDDLEQIARSAERTRTLVRQLLAFSRRQQLRLQRVRVDALVTEAERLLRRVLGEDIVLAVHVEGTPAVVLADPGQLEQVLMNLAVNARDAMRTPAHGHAGTGGMLALEVDATALGADEAAGWDDVAPGRYVRLVVRDTGHGMDAATRARAFEPFFTTKPVGVGTGLGLATVHGIVRQAGGAIRVDSAPGAGTTFTILLPAAEEPDADDEPDARAPIG